MAGLGKGGTPSLSNYPLVQNPQTTAAAANGAVSAGAAMPTAQASNMPDWMRGYAGAATGNPSFGQNAPLINQGLQMALGGQRQPMAPAPMAPRPPMGGIPQMQMPGAPVQGSPFGLMR